MTFPQQHFQEQWSQSSEENQASLMWVAAVPLAHYNPLNCWKPSNISVVSHTHLMKMNFISKRVKLYTHLESQRFVLNKKIEIRTQAKTETKCT